jgi:MFS family permease
VALFCRRYLATIVQVGRLAGAVLGGLLTGRLVRRLGTKRTLYVTYSMYGLLLVPVGLVDSPVTVGVLFFVQGLPLIACGATVRSPQQSIVPGELLGRVGAINRLAHNTVTPLGLAAGGLLASWLGYPGVWIISGCGYLAAFLVNVPAIRSLDTSESN